MPAGGNLLRVNAQVLSDFGSRKGGVAVHREMLAALSMPLCYILAKESTNSVLLLTLYRTCAPALQLSRCTHRTLNGVHETVPFDVQLPSILAVEEVRSSCCKSKLPHGTYLLERRFLPVRRQVFDGLEIHLPGVLRICT